MKDNANTVQGFPSDLLPDALLKALSAAGISSATEVQSKAIPTALAGGDLLVQAPTGSGKTLSFALPLLTRLTGMAASKRLGLVLCPTRELAMQVNKVVSQFGRTLGLRSVLVCGGMPISIQKREIAQGAEVIIGTPGRIADLLRQKALNLSATSLFVLDEVDQMLQVGFQEELNAIHEHLDNTSVQTLFFSATMDPRTRAISKKMLRTPAVIAVKGGESEPNIAHSFVEVRRGTEMKALNNLLHVHDVSQAIVFCERKTECEDAVAFLNRNGFRAAALHGDVQQAGRNQVLTQFKSGRIRFLVATNVAARGIHVDNLPLVINLCTPEDAATYTHRVGRTGRQSAAGRAWTFVTSETVFRFKSICRQLSLKPEEIPVPSSGDVTSLHLRHLFDKSKETALAEKRVPLALVETIEKASQMPEEERHSLLYHLFESYLSSRTSYTRSEFAPRRPLMSAADQRPFARGRGSSRSAPPWAKNKGRPGAKVGRGFKGQGGRSGDPQFRRPKTAKTWK